MAMNGVYSFVLIWIAMFAWDKEKSSKKINVEEDALTVKVKDGSGFKTTLGD